MDRRKAEELNSYLTDASYDGDILTNRIVFDGFISSAYAVSEAPRIASCPINFASYISRTEILRRVS